MRKHTPTEATTVAGTTVRGPGQRETSAITEDRKPANGEGNGRHIFLDKELAKNLEREFHRMAEQGAMGDPHGEVAYGYLRVSSRGQAEEGRSGLPRQLEHIAEKAAQEGLTIPWDMVYCDDHTGFAFEDRPGLNQLIADIKAAPRAGKLVMEYPDRMSRDHTWRYGYLREQFQGLGVEYVYWQGYNSEIERSVMGVISEQGMRKELERMQYGTLRKARSGRVIAKTPAYGYKLVDSQGRDRTDPESKWRTETYCAIVEEEAENMRFIYDSLAYGGATAMALADHLNERKLAPPKNCACWDESLISKLVKNTIYKGEFAAHRWFSKKVWSERSRRLVTRKFERPADEWIIVPVPAIVSRETWNATQQALARNRTVATRNTRYDFLLVNLLVCAECGYSYAAYTKVHRKRGKIYLISSYRCGGRNRGPRVVKERIGCTQSQISAKLLDQAVWNAIMEFLTTPERLAQAMDEYYAGTGVERIHSQLQYVEQQILQRQQEDEKLYRAYMKGAFDEQEFADRRREVRTAIEALQAESEALAAQIISQEEFGRRKQMVSDLAEELRSDLRSSDLPFETKRRIVKMIVDNVQLNVNEGWFKVIGVIRDTFSIHNDEFVSTSMGRGSSPRSS